MAAWFAAEASIKSVPAPSQMKFAELEEIVYLSFPLRADLLGPYKYCKAAISSGLYLRYYSEDE